MAEHGTGILKPFRERFAALETEYSSWRAGHEEISDFIAPTRGFFDEVPNQGKVIDHKKIIDAGPGRSLRTLGSGMASGLSSPSRPWFRLGLRDSELNKFKSVKVWLDDVQKIILSIFQRSNFYPEMHTGYLELGGFGTSADMILEDFRDVIRLRSYTIGEYFLGVGHDQRINTFARKIRMNPLQMIEKFGKDKVSANVLQMYEKNETETWITVHHLIEPNDDRVPDMADNLNMPWRSVYWEAQGKNSSEISELLLRSGFEEFPVLAPRWGTKSSADVYGYGLGHEALGDAKMLQKLQREKLLAIAKVIKPPLQKDASVEGEVNNLPGGVTPTSSTVPDGGVRAAYQIRPDIPAIRDEINSTQRGIDATFFVPLFLAVSTPQPGDRTAREVAEIHEEKLLLLGPVIERVQSEKLGPAIERTFAIANRAGLIPEPPPELAGKDLEIEYISILAQAQKFVGVGALRDHVAFVQDVAAKGSPEALDNLDIDKVVQADADMTGIPAGVNRSQAEVDEIREERAEAAAAQAQQDAILQGAEAAKTASEAKLKDGTSVLDSVNESIKTTREAV